MYFMIKMNMYISLNIRNTKTLVYKSKWVICIYVYLHECRDLR